MTHTLHRMGSEENLEGDYVVFAMAAQGVNRDGAAEKLRRFLEIVYKHRPINCGDMKTGNGIQVGYKAVLDGIQDNSIVHGVFTDCGTVSKVLDDLRREDLGVSVVVSGLLEHVDKCCRDAELNRHTVEYSLGILGDTDRLPEREVLEISTMCGHGMVSFNLVKSMVEKVEKGSITADEAAKKLAANCHCGVVNPRRAAMLLKKMAYRASNQCDRS